jgi:LMBR1-like membrane protein
MASGAGSIIVTVIAFVTICIAVVFLLRHYLPLRTTPAFLLVPIFLALALPASAILLVPIDLASSSGPEDEVSKGIWLSHRPLLVAWRLIYWLTFMLTWFILPLMGEYMDAGYRDPRQRITYSLRSNGRYQLIMLGCAIVGLVYLIFNYGFDFRAIKGLVMALAYVWGLILAIYLAGHGLVAVPRNLIRQSNTSGTLKRVQTRAVRMNEKLEDAALELDEIEAQVIQLKQRKTGTARDFQEWIDELNDMTSQQEERILADPVTMDASTKIPAVITERYLADLTRRLERAQHQRARYVEEWDRIVQSATDLQAVLDSEGSRKLAFGKDDWTMLTPYLRYLFHVRILPRLRLAMGGLFSLASVAVILTEVIKFPTPQMTPVSLTVVHHPHAQDYQVGFGGQVMATAWISYMCVCALSSISDVPVWNGRSLVRRRTHPEAACWYAGQIARLTVPLAYNFVTFLPKAVHRKTVFYDFLGQLINLTPLGTWFDYLFPMFILIPVCFTLFNLYGKIKDWFGFGIIEEEDEDNPSDFATGSWREGRDLIARDLTGDRTAVGLRDSPRTSLDRPRATPTRWVPPTERVRRTERAQASRPASIDPEPEENFVTLFGRRVKNTMDTIDTPKWIQSRPVTRRPRWIGGNDTVTGHGQSSEPRGRNILGFFGRSEGQISV